MPIYEYRCEGCGDKFEVLGGFQGIEGVLCPRCGSRDVRRCFSPFRIRGAGGSSTRGTSSCSSCTSTSCATCH